MSAQGLAEPVLKQLIKTNKNQFTAEYWSQKSWFPLIAKRTAFSIGFT